MSEELEASRALSAQCNYDRLYCKQDLETKAVAVL
jgi:hypothetical protein